MPYLLPDLLGEGHVLLQELVLGVQIGGDGAGVTKCLLGIPLQRSFLPSILSICCLSAGHVGQEGQDVAGGVLGVRGGGAVLNSCQEVGTFYTIVITDCHRREVKLYRFKLLQYIVSGKKITATAVSGRAV